MEKIDRDNADSVLAASVPANTVLYEKMKEDKTVCQALKDLFKEDFDAIEKKYRAELAGKDATIAGKDATIAGKDATIAELKMLLAKNNIQFPSSAQ